MHRVNISIDDNAWLALQEIPKGERSKLLGAAIVQLAESIKRKNACETMDKLCTQLPAVKTAEIVKWIRQDRNRR